MEHTSIPTANSGQLQKPEAGFFPNNSVVRILANSFLSSLGLEHGFAKIRENRKAARPAYDVLHKNAGAKKGRVVFTIVTH